MRWFHTTKLTIIVVAMKGNIGEWKNFDGNIIYGGNEYILILHLHEFYLYLLPYAAKAERGTPFLELTSYDHKLLEGSVNVVSLKIHESKVGYPIRVFGTVLVRDQVDYKCVYLFKRGKNDPQLIKSPVCFHCPLISSVYY